jgi:hypothetical protein
VRFPPCCDHARTEQRANQSGHQKADAVAIITALVVALDVAFAPLFLVNSFGRGWEARVGNFILLSMLLANALVIISLLHRLGTQTS